MILRQVPTHGSLVFLTLVSWAVSIQAADGDKQPPAIVNSLGMRLVKIPAGAFMMGNHEASVEMPKSFPQYDAYRFNLADEYPVHEVRITHSFYLGAYAVTVGEFRTFADQTHYATDAERNDEISSPSGSDKKRSGYGGYGYNPKTGKLDEQRNPNVNWRSVGFPQTERHPVTNVSWNDAVAFCKWLSGKEKKTYRLPTEAEWEYSCRAGSTTRYFFGDDPELLVKFANTYDRSTAKTQPEWIKFALASDDGFPFTAPVGSFAPNKFGLYDMHGNVWQWVSDWYADDYYAHSPVEDPQGPETGGEHLRRGGGWATWAFYCRSSFRNYNTSQSRYFNLGFRVVLEDR